MASVRSPVRRSTSVSVLTVVVLPVPPFWERTAIVFAIAPDTTLRRRWRGVRWPHGRSRGSDPAGRLGCGALRPCSGAGRHGAGAGARGHGGPRADMQEAQPVAPDDDLVAVAQEAPVDAIAVDEHPVQAAVVEQPHPLRVMHDQRVAPRDGRIVEAEIGREAAPDAGPLACQRNSPQLVVLLIDEVVAGLLEPRTSLVEAHAEVRRRGLDQGSVRGLFGAVRDPLRAEQRCAQEHQAAATRAGRQYFRAFDRQRICAVLTTEGTGADESAGSE